jgi:hypothetical protein
MVAALAGFGVRQFLKDLVGSLDHAMGVLDAGVARGPRERGAPDS